MLTKLLTTRNLKILSGVLTLVAATVANYVSGQQQEALIDAKIEARMAAMITEEK